MGWASFLLMATQFPHREGLGIESPSFAFPCPHGSELSLPGPSHSRPSSPDRDDSSSLFNIRVWVVFSLTGPFPCKPIAVVPNPFTLQNLVLCLTLLPFGQTLLELTGLMFPSA